MGPGGTYTPSHYLSLVVGDAYLFTGPSSLSGKGETPHFVLSRERVRHVGHYRRHSRHPENFKSEGQ